MLLNFKATGILKSLEFGKKEMNQVINYWQLTGSLLDDAHTDCEGYQ